MHYFSVTKEKYDLWWYMKTAINSSRKQTVASSITASECVCYAMCKSKYTTVAVNTQTEHGSALES